MTDPVRLAVAAEIAASAPSMDAVLLANEVREAIENLPEESIDAAHAALSPLLCKHAGHLAVPDNCGRPEHDYCSRCNVQLPGQAQRAERRS